MKSKFSFALIAVWIANAAAGMAQEARPGQPVFTRDAISRALSGVTGTLSTPQDPRSDWSGLNRLTNNVVVLYMTGSAPKESRIVAVDDAALTVVDLEGPSRATIRVPRPEVSEIRQWTGRRGSPLGAVIGAGAGLFLGVVSAVNLAYKQCGDSCRDERFLIGASLVGMPVAGGFLGYRLPGGNRTLTTIYVKPESAPRVAAIHRAERLPVESPRVL